MLPATMKTVELHDFGKPDVLYIGERKLPDIKPDEVLVEVHAAGVNGPDLVQRRGHYPPPEGASDLLGLEVSGTVVAGGDQVERWNVGDTVCALTNGGGYAGYVAIKANHCLAVPANVSIEDAAGLPETCFTVWSNCFMQPMTENGDLFLVHGGAGGIGSTAIQMGVAQGLRVMTTCSADDKTFCESLGAERAIDYRDEDFVDTVKSAGGASLILDIVGGDYVARNIKAARADARIVQLAFNQGARVDINLMPIMLKRLTYTGSTLRSRPDSFKAAVAASLEKAVWPWFESNRMRTQTHTVLPIEHAADAHRI